MGSIYGNRRDINTETTKNINSKEIKKDNVRRNNYHKDIKKILLTAAVVNFVVAAILIVFSFIAIAQPDSRAIYIKFVFLPVIAFVGSFISGLLNKDFFMNISGCAIILLLTFFIFVEFSFSAIIWVLFYLISSIIGIMSSYIATTFK